MLCAAGKAVDLSPAWKERSVAAALGVVVALVAWIGGNSAIFPPELWDKVCVAAGMRPPPNAIPGLWTWLTSHIFDAFGLSAGLSILRFLGPVSLGLLTVLVYFFIMETEPATLDRRMLRKGWSRRIVRFVLMQGACFFIFSDPVWRAGRVFSPTMLQLILAVLALRLMFMALDTSCRVHAIAMAAVSGLVAADSPIGFLPMLAFPLVVIMNTGHTDDPLVVPFANPLVRVVTFRRMTLAFLFTWLLAVTVNSAFFKAHDGLDAHDWNAFTYFIHYLHNYSQLVTGAATPVGWLFIIGVVAAPLAMAAVLVNKATDDDKFLPYMHGLFFAFVGVMSFLQFSGWSSFWFWRWVRAPTPVRSEFLLCLCLLAVAFTATCSLCVIGVEVFFRNYRRIALTRYQDAVEDGATEASRTMESFRLIDRVVRAVLIYEPLLAAALVIPFRLSATEREMGRVVNDYAVQTAEECGDARHLFTDGAMDGPVEVAAELQGRRLKALSMMSGSDPYEIYLRTRGEEDEENRIVLSTGAADALRTWVRHRPDCATNIAVQLGFELWKHDKLPMPPLGGVVARTAGFAEGAAERWTEAAHVLADRILALYDDADGAIDVPDDWLQSAFTFVQWRIARMCGMRADEADRAGDLKRALRENDIAKWLDDRNAAYQRIRRQMDWVARQKGVRLTPREGLRIGLERADFRLARTFAQQILASDPYDTRANFAMGMSYFTEDMFGRAEHYLKLALTRSPNEPAVLNNLSVVQMRLGRLDEAETNALKALKAYPTSLEIKKTIQKIRDAKSPKM